MLRNRPLATLFILALSCASVTAAPSEIPKSYRIDGVPRIKQMTNYCGPACLAAVFQFLGRNIAQEEIGKSIYNATYGATTGPDMLHYAQRIGYTAYLWNSSLGEVKAKIATGTPVIALQQNSYLDRSGHYRVLIGYDDVAGKFYVMDPYYDQTEMSYDKTERLWRAMGYWALMIMPPQPRKDTAGNPAG